MCGELGINDLTILKFIIGTTYIWVAVALIKYIFKD